MTKKTTIEESTAVEAVAAAGGRAGDEAPGSGQEFFRAQALAIALPGQLCSTITTGRLWSLTANGGGPCPLTVGAVTFLAVSPWLKRGRGTLPGCRLRCSLLVSMPGSTRKRWPK